MTFVVARVTIHLHHFDATEFTFPAHKFGVLNILKDPQIENYSYHAATIIYIPCHSQIHGRHLT